MGHVSSAARNELPREAERVAIRPRLHVARPGRTRREHGGGTAMGAECITCCARLPVRSCIQHAEPCGVGSDSGRASSKVCFRAPCLWLPQQRGPWWLNADAVPLATTRFDHRPGCTAAVFPTPRTRCPNPTPNGASSHLLCLCSAALPSAVFPPHLCRTVAGSDSLAPYPHHSARLHWRYPR
jgi:hypothetical protein